MTRLRQPRFPALLLAVHGWLFAGFPALRGPNELSRLAEARALASDRSVFVDAQLAGQRVGDLGVRAGRHFAAKAPGVSWLGAPAGVLAAELLRRLLARRFGERLARAGAATCGVATPEWPCSTQLVGYGPTAAALVACWWALDLQRDGDAARWPVLAVPVLFDQP